MQLKHFVRRTFVPILNIIGMSISLMVLLVLFAQVWFDFRFNRNFKDYENIYRFEEHVNYDARDYSYDQVTLRPLIEKFEKCSPDVLVACDYEDCDLGLNLKIIYDDNGTARKYDMPTAMADSSLPKVFSLKFIAGSADDFCHENDAIISEDCAELIFGNDNPIGKTLTREMTGDTFKVVGVYENLPENCSIINGMIFNEGDFDLTIPNHYIHSDSFAYEMEQTLTRFLRISEKPMVILRKLQEKTEIPTKLTYVLPQLLKLIS